MARNTFFRFRTFLSRFWPLWLVLLVAFILPPSREMMRFHIVTSDIAPQFYNWGQFWIWFVQDVKPAPLLKREPQNAALALWNLRYQNEHSGSDYLYYDEDMVVDTPSSSNNEQLLELSQKFLDESWLKGHWLRAYVVDRNAEISNFYSQSVPIPSGATRTPSSSPKKKNSLKTPDDKYRLIQKFSREEPDNAFWLVCEAHFRALEFNYGAAKQLLARAGSRKFYDDKSLETSRNLIQVQQRFRPLAWEEKKVLYEDANEESQFLQYLTPPLQKLSNHSLRHDNFQQKLQTSVSLMRIGALMQRGNNSLATCREGANWQSLAWRLGNPVKKWNLVQPKGHLSFGEYVKKRGFPELAKEALQLKHESVLLERWMNQPNNESWGDSPIYLNLGGLASRANTARDAGMVLASYCGYLAAWWFFLNVFLFRGQGMASTRRERMVPVVVFGAIFIVLGLIVAWWFSQTWNGTTPRSPRRDEIFVTIALLAFFGLPFILAAFCALNAVRRFKSDFFLLPRVDLELQLTAFQLAYLRWLLPLTVISSVAMLILGWLLFCFAVVLDWGNFNLLAILPPDRNGSYGFSGTLDFYPAREPIPFIYGVFMCCICIVVWFFKWRFFTPVALKPFTHTSLRRWKEILGMAIVSTVWLYILLAVCLWPTRLEIERRMDKVLISGPLSMMAKSGANSS